MKIKEFFYLQKSDRQVAIVLVGAIAVALLLIYGVGGGLDESTLTLADTLATDSSSVVYSRFESSSKTSYSRQAPSMSYGDYEAKTPERFPFDPNVADSDQLLRLGLPSWMVRNIYKYRSRGGVFRSREDFARVYGLTLKQYEELLPFIRISPLYQSASAFVSRDTSAVVSRVRCDTLRYPVKLKRGESVELSTADTTLLKRVPGIGSYRARAIVAYGRRLGGYVDVRQVLEVDGVPEEAVAFLTVGSPSVRRLNVNALPLSELRRHPYLRYERAKAIVDYRRLHGRLCGLDALRLLPAFTEADIERLRPYVSF